jgi:D-lactate dehydrogenase
MGLCCVIGNILWYYVNVVHRNYFSFLFELQILKLFLFFTFHLFHYSYDAICLFVNDTADANVLHILSLLGVKMITMRCAGFDRIDT